MSNNLRLRVPAHKGDVSWQSSLTSFLQVSPRRSTTLFATHAAGLTLRVGDVAASSGCAMNDGDGRLYRNVTIGELDDGEVARVTDYGGRTDLDPGEATGDNWSARHAGGALRFSACVRSTQHGTRAGLDLAQARAAPVVVTAGWPF